MVSLSTSSTQRARGLKRCQECCTGCPDSPCSVPDAPAQGSLDIFPADTDAAPTDAVQIKVIDTASELRDVRGAYSRRHSRASGQNQSRAAAEADAFAKPSASVQTSSCQIQLQPAAAQARTGARRVGHRIRARRSAAVGFPQQDCRHRIGMARTVSRDKRANLIGHNASIGLVEDRACRRSQ